MTGCASFTGTNAMFDWTTPLILMGFSTLFYWLGLSYYYSDTQKLKKFPTIRSTFPILSYLGTANYLKDPPKFVHEGIKKFQGRLFKIPTPMAWWVVVSKPELVEDLRKAPEHILSANRSLTEELQSSFTLGSQITENPYHIPIIRTQLTRAIPKFLPELHAEMMDAFSQFIPATEDWSGVKILEATRSIVALVSGRIFVGIPLSRNKDWIKLNLDVTEDMVKTAFVLRLFPSFLRPLVNFCISKVPDHHRRGVAYLTPLISARRKERDQQSSTESIDVLNWLLAEAKGEEATDWFIAARIFNVYFAAIHTTSMALSQALFYLALLPEYWKPLRDEVEEALNREGWTKDALDRMRKIDSFIKESQRLHPASILMMNRTVVDGYTFSDGTEVPAGTNLSVSISHTHLNPDNYEEPSKFDGFRFCGMKDSAEAAGYPDKKFDMVATSLQHLAFGHGRHACPGRFFAAAELKMMLAYIVITYDLKLVDGVRPPDVFLLHTCLPNPTAEILFRRRADVGK